MPVSLRSKGDAEPLPLFGCASAGGCAEEPAAAPAAKRRKGTAAPSRGGTRPADVAFNAGGPVWALDWCPTYSGGKGDRQYLAVGAGFRD